MYLFIADGHDELGTEFVSLEKYAKDAAEYLRAQGIGRVDAMYGVSMGGAAVIRFLATEDIPVEKAIIDAGITPYPYPKLICRLISVKDWIMIMLGTRSLRMMKLACPPERWTPKGRILFRGWTRKSNTGTARKKNGQEKRSMISNL